MQLSYFSDIVLACFSCFISLCALFKHLIFSRQHFSSCRNICRSYSNLLRSSLLHPTAGQIWIACPYSFTCPCTLYWAVKTDWKSSFQSWSSVVEWDDINQPVGQPLPKWEWYRDFHNWFESNISDQSLHTGRHLTMSRRPKKGNIRFLRIEPGLLISAFLRLVFGDFPRIPPSNFPIRRCKSLTFFSNTLHRSCLLMCALAADSCLYKKWGVRCNFQCLDLYRTHHVSHLRICDLKWSARRTTYRQPGNVHVLFL